MVTLNTWGHDGPYQKRWNFFLEELKTLNPDVVCLQEVFEPTLTEQIKKTLNFPYSVASTEAGLAMITRFTVLSEKVVNYKTASPIESYNRRAVIVTLRAGTKKITFANTHLAWKPEDEATRLGQVQELLRAVKKEKDPAILAGDFNDTPESAPVQEVKRSGYHDLYGSLHPNEAGLTWDNRNPFIQTHAVKLPDRRIDFIFAQERLLTTSPSKICSVVFNHPNSAGVYPSDHYGLFAEIDFNTQSNFG